jgi:carbamoyl-phosphate synthase large subunit
MSGGSGSVVVTCGGKWVGMILQLRQAMRRHPQLRDARIVVASCDALTAAGCFADAAEQVPLIRDPEYVDRLLDVCRRHEARVVIPLIDLDLERLAPHAERFAAAGARLVCPTPELVELCLDKLLFERFCREHGLAHPPYRELAELDEQSFPVFGKRRRGFGSIGSGICRTADEAREMVAAAPDTLFQPVIEAPEISVDAYVAASGACIVRVPRSRDKVVAGEAYRTRTLPASPVTELARRTVEALASGGLRGPLNVQLFDADPPCLIEVNTRLGSASVLSNMAVGGRLLDALLDEALGGEAGGDPDAYDVGLSLTRFLGDVFHHGTDVVALLPG